MEGCRKGPPTYDYLSLCFTGYTRSARRIMICFLVDLTGSSRNSRTSCRIPSMASNHLAEHWLCNVTRTKSSICSAFFIPIDCRTTRLGNTSVTTTLQFSLTLRDLLRNCGCTLIICTHPEHLLRVWCLPNRHTGLVRPSLFLHPKSRRMLVECASTLSR